MGSLRAVAYLALVRAVLEGQATCLFGGCYKEPSCSGIVDKQTGSGRVDTQLEPDFATVYLPSYGVELPPPL